MVVVVVVVVVAVKTSVSVVPVPVSESPFRHYLSSHMIDCLISRRIATAI